MLVVPAKTAFSQLRENVRHKMVHMPSKTEPGQYVDGGIFPRIRPAFSFRPGSKIFTVGSCFAREVELVLRDAGFEVPVSNFEIPEDELPLPGPHLLNEYNAGTIVQRLDAVTGLFDYGDKGIEQTAAGAIDLFLHIGSKAVALDRLRERRREIAKLYRQLLDSDVVVITLGLVECWYDTVDGCYVNRAPSQATIHENPDRFEFHRMDVDDVVDRIGRAIEGLLAMGPKQVLLTVSPVPLEATFMAEGCPIANGYSKAVLRVCAEVISQRYAQVTYFPSFEIVNSFGTPGYRQDNVHVEPYVVHHIMHYLITNFSKSEESDPGKKT